MLFRTESWAAILAVFSFSVQGFVPLSAFAAETKLPVSVSSNSGSGAPVDPKLTAKLEEAVENDNFFEADELIKLVSESEIARDPRLLVVKALIAKGLYKLDDAYKLLRAALKINRNFAPAQYEIALIFMERKVWKDAEVLLRLAAASDTLQGQRKQLLPYYLGVIAFETGRLFEARSSFLRLNWNASLDPAIEQSMTTFVSKISKRRPWNVIFPLSVQYDSNLISLPDSAALPAAYSGRQGTKLIAGVFGNREGLSFGGDNQGGTPFGAGLKFFAVRHFQQTFSALDIQFLESELNWSKLINPDWGVLKLASSVNLVRAGGKSVTSTLAARSNIKDTEFSAGYEADLQKSPSSDKSSILLRASREYSLFSGGGFNFGLPAETGGKLPLAKNPSEFRFDAALTPSLGYSQSKRWNLKLTEKMKIEHVKSVLQAAGFVAQSATGVSYSISIQPYLVTSTGATFEVEKNFNSGDSIRKTTATLSLVGLL